MAESGIPPPWIARSRRYRSSLMAGLVILLGGSVLFAWAAGLSLPPRLIPGWPAMQPLAAVSFIVAGLALHLYAARRFRATAVPLLLLALLAGSALLQYITGGSLGIDTLLFREAVLAQAGKTFPGRILELNSLGFLLFCLCLALPRRSVRQYRRVGLVASLGLGFAFAHFSGYVLGARGFTGDSFITLSAPASIGLMLLFGGILQGQRGRTWPRLLRSPSSGGRAARSLLPLILGWPLAVGVIVNLVTPSLINPHQPLALALVFVMLLLAVLVVRFARQLDRVEAGRLAAHAALRETEERYRSVVETASDGIITIDGEARILFANPAAARMFGYSVAELQAGKLTLLMSEATRAKHEADFADYLVTGRRHSSWRGVEVSGRHRDGREIPVEVSYDEFRRNGGCFFTGIVRDISERKRAESALQYLTESLDQRVRERTAELSRSNDALMRGNLELQRFAYVASHDLQTPLRSITGFVQLLQQNYGGRLDDQADLWIGLVVDNTCRLQKLIQELLAYSRVDAQAHPFEPTDFRRIFDEELSALEGLIRETRAEVSCGELPVVSGDRIQLSQVLENLLDNAIKYHGEAPPRIHVWAERQEGEWLFSVRDNGIGIAARHHERIFEIFRRLHTQQAYPGTGVGLAICRRVIHRHGGRIWVESEPGQGSTFRFTLPDKREE